jgi:hypothetical protein
LPIGEVSDRAWVNFDSGGAARDYPNPVTAIKAQVYDQSSYGMTMRREQSLDARWFWLADQIGDLPCSGPNDAAASVARVSCCGANREQGRMSHG